MKTLLINPPSEKVVEPLDRPDWPHIGLGYVAAYLRANGHAVSIVDGKLENIGVQEVIERVGKVKPDIIGLSAYTSEIIHVARLAKSIKQKYPDITVVIGGIHASILPEETLREFSIFDYVIFGEGEITLHELVDTLEKAGSLGQIKGLGFRKDGIIHLNEKRDWNSALDNLPFPAWDMFPEAKIYPMMTSRGCPFQCIFCTRPYGDNIRERSAENVAAEFKELVNKYRAKNVMFFDETFGVNRKRAIRIADMLAEENNKGQAVLLLQTRVDTVDYELLKRLKMAGCRQIAFGVESGNEKILKLSKKGITLDQAKKAVKAAKELGLITNSFFIIGFPHETKKTAWDTINFARQLNTDYVAIGKMTPYPKTEIARMVKNGEGGYRQISYDWSEFDKQSGAVVELEGMSHKTIARFQILGYLMFYVCNLHFGILFKIIKERYRQIPLLVRKAVWGAKPADLKRGRIKA